MIRILRVITRLNIGGPSIQAARLSTTLTAEGFDTLLIHGRLGEGEGDMSYLLQDSGARVQHLALLQRPIAPWTDLRAAVALYRAIGAFQPHLLHTHMAKAGLLGRAAAIVYNMRHPSRRVRIVHTYHGHVLEGYFSGTMTRLFIALERALGRFTDTLIAVSARVRDDLLQRYRIGSRATFTVVPLGLELDELAEIDDRSRATARRTLGLGDTALAITTVGRLTGIKDHALFLAAADRMANQMRDVVFLIAGDGELRAVLEEDARRRGLGDRVRFLGWRRDLATIYAASDLFMLTSKNEGTPVALIEAMASGVPGVATDVGGVRDVIASESLGIVVPHGDATALADAARGLLTDVDRRRRMGSAARESVMATFTVARLTRDIADVYRRLLAQDRR